MRRLLRSKRGVSILCVGAAIAVAANFVHLPAPRGPLRVAARGTAPAVPADPGGETWVVPPVARVVAALSAWRGLFPLSDLGRDPFALGLAVGLSRPSAPPSGDASAGLSVQAISIDGGRALAILNHRVVAVGDRIGEYEVEQIRAGEVHLRGRWGRLVVPVRLLGSQKPASGNVQPADLPPGKAAVPPGAARP